MLNRTSIAAPISVQNGFEPSGRFQGFPVRLATVPAKGAVSTASDSARFAAARFASASVYPLRRRASLITSGGTEAASSGSNPWPISASLSSSSAFANAVAACSAFSRNSMSSSIASRAPLATCEPFFTYTAVMMASPVANRRSALSWPVTLPLLTISWLKSVSRSFTTLTAVTFDASSTFSLPPLAPSRESPSFGEPQAPRSDAARMHMPQQMLYLFMTLRSFFMSISIMSQI